MTRPCDRRSSLHSHGRRQNEGYGAHHNKIHLRMSSHGFSARKGFGSRSDPFRPDPHPDPDHDLHWRSKLKAVPRPLAALSHVSRTAMALAPGPLKQERLLPGHAVDDQPAAAHLNRVAARRDDALDEHLLVLQREPAFSSRNFRRALRQPSCKSSRRPVAGDDTVCVSIRRIARSQSSVIACAANARYRPPLHAQPPVGASFTVLHSWCAKDRADAKPRVGSC